MITIVGLIVVFGAVLGGFGMGGGPFAVLIQPSELVVIGGAALGTIIISAPGKMRSRIGAAIKKAFSGKGYVKTDYMDALQLQYQIYTTMKRSGALALESHLAKPAASDLFKKYPSFLGNHHAMHFFTDALRQVVNGIKVDDLDMLLEAELETLHEEEHLPVSLLKMAGDALPGLGIVAAVLGIVITMGHLDGGPEEIGHHVAAALVGTFLGILLCYGMIQPIATNIEMRMAADAAYLKCFKAGVLAYQRTNSPSVAVEFARKAIFSDERPSADETDKACEAAKGGAQLKAA